MHGDSHFLKNFTDHGLLYIYTSEPECGHGLENVVSIIVSQCVVVLLSCCIDWY